MCAPRCITRWCARGPGTFSRLDHSAIYLLIAGTYTPFTLVALGGATGWTLFGAEWALAVAGIVFKSLVVNRFAVLSALVYLFQGWLALFVARPLLGALGWHGTLWLFAGGLAHTPGIIFFALDHRPVLSRRVALVRVGGERGALLRDPVPHCADARVNRQKCGSGSV